jgi:SsrA-binding protein
VRTGRLCNIMAKNSKKTPSNVIADNRKSRHDFQLLEQFEAGVVLEGWEVKSLRAGRGQLRDSYVVMKQGEAWLVGAHFSILNTTCTQSKTDPTRSRKLLLSKRELKKLDSAVSQKGLTAVPVNLHWTKNRVKLQIALARGKKSHDKRDALKERAQKRDNERIIPRG